MPATLVIVASHFQTARATYVLLLSTQCSYISPGRTLQHRSQRCCSRTQKLSTASGGQASFFPPPINPIWAREVPQAATYGALRQLHKSCLSQLIWEKFPEKPHAKTHQLLLPHCTTPESSQHTGCMDGTSLQFLSTNSNINEGSRGQEVHMI